LENSEERQALIAQLVEHALGKGGVMGSTPIEGSLCRNEIEFILQQIKERSYGEAEV
jgi:hypothetical protein